MSGTSKRTVERALNYRTEVKLIRVVSAGGVAAGGRRMTAMYQVATSMADADFSGLREDAATAVGNND